jgi:peptidoglycan/LPS O-acetylase OafA/YrhL
MRIRTLDGLRGIAAAVVLVHHCFASLPVLGGVYAFPRGTIPNSMRWFVFSPLHLIWAGQEAVYVFFILSGLVLTLPVFRRRYFWRSYYPSRLIRLYLPVVASVCLALLVVALVPRALANGHGDWMENLALEPTLVGVLKDLTLARPDLLNGPLWSLRWEVVFSLLLPIYLWLAFRLARWPWALIAASVLTSALGGLTGRAWLMYLPLFMIGAALAIVLDSAGEREPSRAWPWITGGALIGLTASWWLEPYVMGASVLSTPLVLFSATALVFAAARWRQAATLLDTSALQWLGSRSFSLYLVHYPLVVAVASLVAPDHALLVPVVAIPIALVVSEVFFRAVESPAVKLARWVGTGLPRREALPRRC